MMYTLVALLVVFGTLMLVSNSMIQSVRYPDLIALIENTRFQERGKTDLVDGATGEIEVIVDKQRYR
ncbi:MAG: hypothetical protein KGQ60_18755, partial [Planctomycetes bacterium]|nr:hypothetical protein [Planctomycetota bacterium]